VTRRTRLTPYLAPSMGVPAGESAEDAIAIAGVCDTKDAQATSTSRSTQVGLGILWTILARAGGFHYSGLAALCTGTAFSSEEVQEYETMARTARQSTAFTALAPWVVGGIVFGARWCKSRGSRASETTDQDAERA
jgi:hypothetical protein